MELRWRTLILLYDGHGFNEGLFDGMIIFLNISILMKINVILDVYRAHRTDRLKYITKALSVHHQDAQVGKLLVS